LQQLDEEDSRIFSDSNLLQDSSALDEADEKISQDSDLQFGSRQ